MQGHHRQVRFWWLRRVAPSVDIQQGFVRAGGFVPGWPLRSSAVKPSFSLASASRQEPKSGTVEFVAMQSGLCHNKSLKL